MKAIIQDTYGAPEVLELRDIDPPEIGDDDVLIRVRAAGVHIGDWHLMTGLPYLMRMTGAGLSAPKARVRGIDVAGTVEEVGKDVTQFRAGQTVVIIGASGGVGLFAVQLAKAFGADVTGVCSTRNVALVRSIGADRVVDYTREDFTRSGRRYDLLLDLAGNRSLSSLRRALAPRGTLVLVGGEGGDRWIGGMDRQLRALLRSPFVSQRLRPFFATEKHEDLLVLKDLIEAGRVTPVLDRTYALSEARDAIRYLKAGHVRGKVVITLWGADHGAGRS